MEKKLRLGLVGFGARGTDLLKNVLIPMSDIDIELCAVCDLYPDRAEQARKMIIDAGKKEPLCSTDYKDIVTADVDAVIIMTAWEAHIEIAVAAMNAGKAVGMEVGGAYSIEDCWRLVDTAEATKMPCMMLENCCYGKRELMILNMVRRGLFGDVVYCEGGYRHDLREEITSGAENRHYRLRNYLNRNCENYPTHELGPIAKILRINNDNRMVTLSSVASCAKGLHAYAVDRLGAEHKLSQAEFRQGDVVKTLIRCQNGELITLTLDTTLPCSYSRNFTVQGTKAAYFEASDSLYIDKQDAQYEFEDKKLWGSAEKYEQEHLHPLWRDYDPKGGHGGMDWLVFRAFVESILGGIRTPIDVYDTASWMCISALSERSIQEGGAPQEIPDFTRGQWKKRAGIPVWEYGLDHPNLTNAK